MQPRSDAELILQVRRGDRQAYGALVERYQSMIFSVCYRLLGNPADAEDLAQEAFLRAYRRLERYDAERPFGPWLRRLAANLCLTWLKSRPQGFRFDEELDSLASDQQPGPEQQALLSERSDDLHSALLSLPEHYRVVIELRHFAEYSYTEIAEELNLPMSDVKTHLYRARQALARLLEGV